MSDATPSASLWFLAWAFAAVLVGGMGLFVYVRQSFSHIRLAELDRQVQRLLSANNRPRAIKLAQAIPDHPLLVLLLFALTHRLPVTPAPPGAASYRDPAQSAPFEQRALDALLAEADRLAAPFSTTVLRLVLVLGPIALLGAALGVLDTDPALRLHTLLSVAALVALAAALLSQRKALRRDLHDASVRWARFVEPA